MGKKPSTETQLKTLKSEFASLQRRNADVINHNCRLKAELVDIQMRLARSEHERKQLLDAMCAHVKSKPVMSETLTAEEPTTFCQWTVGPQKILAIKMLRETSGLGLHEAKDRIEFGRGHLTAQQQAAIAPYVTFIAEAAQ